MASLFAALSCCLPLGTLLLAAGSAGAALFTERLRPLLLVLSVACLGFAFVQTYFRSRCEFRQRRLRTVLLWVSAAILATMFAAPRFASSVLAGRLPALHATSELHAFDEAQFVREFNAANRYTRVVVLLSPT